MGPNPELVSNKEGDNLKNKKGGDNLDLKNKYTPKQTSKPDAINPKKQAERQADCFNLMVNGGIVQSGDGRASVTIGGETLDNNPNSANQEEPERVTDRMNRLHGKPNWQK